MDKQLEQLVGAARQQTLAAFDKAVNEGDRDPAAEAATYQRRRRDYATWLRMESPAPEARELAASLLERHGITLEPELLEEFELAITRMLVELYEEFLRRA
ncbi:MAG: hypothetical protein R3270_05970 [Gammaproteobacteria bacterium]|nr:hypothetical protein [Gammaproteobacteria bacterium]